MNAVPEAAPAPLLSNVRLFVVLDVIVADAPRETVVPLIVTLEFVRDELPMFDSVLLAPLIVLLVSVCDPVSVATVESMAIVTGAEPS